MTVFEPEVVEAVCGYMNSSQAESVLLIAKVLGGASDATAAVMTEFDGDELIMQASTANGETEVRLAWPHPCETRADVKDRLFLLVDQAVTAWDGK